MKAIWENSVLADSENTIVIEGNHYFPPASIKREYLTPSDTRTTCHWKGIASYYHIQVGEKTNADAAWCYAEPKDAVKAIKDFVAFWRGVDVTK